MKMCNKQAKSRWILVGGVTAGLMVLALQGATAQAALITAYSGVGFTTAGDWNPLIAGHQFTVTGTGITVQSLGVFDFGADGLVNSHEVTLFSITAINAGGGSPVALGSVTVPAGTGATLDSSMRFQSLATPIFLVAGNYSVIAYGFTYHTSGDTGGDGGTSNPTLGLPVAGNNVTNITFSAYEFTTAGSPHYPNGGWGGNNLADASFQFNVGNTAPEPASLGLLAIGGLLMLPRARRR